MSSLLELEGPCVLSRSMGCLGVASGQQNRSVNRLRDDTAIRRDSTLTAVRAVADFTNRTYSFPVSGFHERAFAICSDRLLCGNGIEILPIQFGFYLAARVIDHAP